MFNYCCLRLLVTVRTRKLWNRKTTFKHGAEVIWCCFKTSILLYLNYFLRNYILITPSILDTNYFLISIGKSKWDICFNINTFITYSFSLLWKLRRGTIQIIKAVLYTCHVLTLMLNKFLNVVTLENCKKKQYSGSNVVFRSKNLKT